jgi:hypothetical protein
MYRANLDVAFGNLFWSVLSCAERQEAGGS